MTSNETRDFSATTVTIRKLEATDHAELELLAERDSSRTPDGPMIGVLVEGRLLAATSLTSGETIADPFSRTAELRSLLELRAMQLRGRTGRRTRLALRSARPARAALAGSPPGGGGRLLTLLPRSG